MALPDYLKRTLGTPIIWGEAGATTVFGAVTNTLSLDALVKATARMGAYADLGAAFPEKSLLFIVAETGTAPTAGNTVDVHLAWSPVSSVFPGGVTGSDGAWPSDGNEDEWAPQIGHRAGSLIATNDATTVQIQGPFIITNRCRYVAPVYDNNLDQDLRNETTASDNTSCIAIYPIIDSIEDS